MNNSNGHRRRVKPEAPDTRPLKPDEKVLVFPRGKRTDAAEAMPRRKKSESERPLKVTVSWPVKDESGNIVEYMEVEQFKRKFPAQYEAGCNEIMRTAKRIFEKHYCEKLSEAMDCRVEPWQFWEMVREMPPEEFEECWQRFWAFPDTAPVQQKRSK